MIIPRILIHDNNGNVVFNGNSEAFKSKFPSCPETNYKKLDIFCQTNSWAVTYPPQLVEIDAHDAHFICYSLAQGLKKEKQELQILQETKTRDLTTVEKHMLPGSLCRYTRSELQEQIDPWITLVDHYQDLIEKINKATEPLEG
jgi:hypothetical protein